jgi:hypothetical protein
MCFVANFNAFETKARSGNMDLRDPIIFFFGFLLPLWDLQYCINSPAPVDPEQRGEGEASDPEVPVRRWQGPHSGKRRSLALL